MLRAVCRSITATSSNWKINVGVPHITTTSARMFRRANKHLPDYTDDEAIAAFKESGSLANEKYIHVTNEEFDNMTPSEQTEFWKSKMLNAVKSHYEGTGDQSDEPFFDDEFYDDAEFPEEAVMAPLKNQSFSKSNNTNASSTPKKSNTNENVESTINTEGIDFTKVFAKSRLSKIFSSDPSKTTLFSRMHDRRPMYFSGTRRIISPDGVLNEASQVYLSRTIDKSANMMTDRMVTFDLHNDAPFEQEVITHVDPTTGKAHVVDADEATGKVRSRTFIQLRGKPWEWHSAAAISQLEYSEVPLKDGLPLTVSRVRFNEDALINERIILQNNIPQLSLIDEINEVSETQFHTKIIKMFEEYQKKMAEEMEEDATQFEEYEKQNGKVEESDGEYGLGMGMNNNRGSNRNGRLTKKGGRRM